MSGRASRLLVQVGAVLNANVGEPAGANAGQ